MADDVKVEKNINWRKLLIGEWNWKRPIKLVAFVYVSLAVIGFFFSEKFMFPHQQSSYGAKTEGLKMLTAEDGTQLATRYWKAPGLEKGLILYFHGNLEDIGVTGPIADTLGKLGYSLLAMDYRGYGLSEGSPTEENCYADAELMYKEALAMGYSSDQMVLWGRSLGGGVAVEMAKRKQVKGLVLESTFCTAFRAATYVKVLPFDKFDSLSKMEEIEEPMFIIHGAEDEIIAPWHTEKLFEAHQGRKERHLVVKAGHDNVWTKPLKKELVALAAFLSE